MHNRMLLSMLVLRYAQAVSVFRGRNNWITFIAGETAFFMYVVGGFPVGLPLLSSRRKQTMGNERRPTRTEPNRT